MRKKAFFITFEGLEGSGKSSQIANVANHFTQKGLKVIQTREPGGTDLAEKIRHLLVHQQTEPLSPRAELLLMLAARAQHVDELIQKNMYEVDMILCDRFTDSTLAYQGGGRSINMNFLIEMNRFATDMLSPDLTFLMDLSVSDSQARIQNRQKKSSAAKHVDRFETENESFHHRVREIYLALSKEQSHRFVVLDGIEKPQVIFQKMVQVIEERLERERHS